jgi:transposase
MMFADELDIHLLKVGAAWMPKGTQMAIMTLGTHAKDYLAGALDLATGMLHHCLGARKTNVLCRDLLTALEERYPAEQYTRLFLPTYCPCANPIGRAFVDVHDTCIRNHQRKR